MGILLQIYVSVSDQNPRQWNEPEYGNIGQSMPYMVSTPIEYGFRDSTDYCGQGVSKPRQDNY